MSFLSAAKDRMVEKMAATMLNRSVLQAYGRLVELKLDSEAKTIEANVELKGESTPVRVLLQDYVLVREDGRLFLVVKRISTSREWLTALANDWAANRKFAVPDEAASVMAQCL